MSMAAKERSILAGERGPVEWLRSGLKEAKEVGGSRAYFSAGLSSAPFVLGARYDFPLTLRIIAPSTSRSRKAIARGPSERYSPHLSKSTFVTSAVERF